MRFTTNDQTDKLLGENNFRCIVNVRRADAARTFAVFTYLRPTTSNLRLTATVSKGFDLGFAIEFVRPPGRTLLVFSCFCFAIFADTVYDAAGAAKSAGAHNLCTNPDITASYT
eukprot:1188197-Prorocentrum_minimum.AAC.3